MSDESTSSRRNGEMGSDKKCVQENFWGTVVERKVYAGSDDDEGMKLMNTTLEVVGENPETRLGALTLDEHDNLFQSEYILFHSKTPFLVIRRFKVPVDGCSVHLAHLVNEHKISGTLPRLTLPGFHPSHAVLYTEPKAQFSEWCRLRDLARIVRLSLKEVLKHHEEHMFGEEGRMFYAEAETAQELFETEDCLDFHNPDETPSHFLDGDLSNVWVTKEFAIMVSYFNLLGWHNQFRFE